MKPEEVREIAMMAVYDYLDSGSISTPSLDNAELQVFIRFAAEVERRTLERAAERAEAYAYMSPNFTALADELRGLKPCS